LLSRSLFEDFTFPGTNKKKRSNNLNNIKEYVLQIQIVKKKYKNF
jgi:hypothetical protein